MTVENPTTAQIALKSSEGCHPTAYTESIVANPSDDILVKEKIAQTLKVKLKNLKKIDSVWLEHLGKEVYVYIDALDTGKATLRPIFDVQYDVEEEYPHFSFHFRVDSQELESKKMNNHLLRII